MYFIWLKGTHLSLQVSLDDEYDIYQLFLADTEEVRTDTNREGKNRH